MLLTRLLKNRVRKNNMTVFWGEYTILLIISNDEWEAPVKLVKGECIFKQYIIKQIKKDNEVMNLIF